MKNQLRDFIFRELIFVAEPERFGDDDNLLDAGLDSMGIMRLVMFIESTFAITLPDTEIEPDNLQSFNALERWILRHQQHS
ncbi:MAG: acyl carrier protein [Gammaproteobacteria bacterium]